MSPKNLYFFGLNKFKNIIGLGCLNSQLIGQLVSYSKYGMVIEVFSNIEARFSFILENESKKSNIIKNKSYLL